MRLDAGDAPRPDIRLREAEPSDEPFLRALYRSAREPELALTGWPEAQKAAFADSQFDLQARSYRENYPGVQFLVVEREGVPVGRLYVQARAGEVILMDITLAPQERGRGLGTLLVRWVMRLAGERGASVSLHVETFNPARALYARLGFVPEGTDGVYLPMRWRPTGG